MVDFVDLGGEFVEEFREVGEEFRGDVARLASDAGIGCGEAGTGELLAEVVDLLAFGEGVEEDGHGTAVHGEDAHAEEVG